MQLRLFHMSILLHSEVLPRLVQNFSENEDNRRETVDLVNRVIDDDEEASAESRKRKAPGLPQFISKVVLQKTQDLENLTGDSADDTQSDDEDVVTACDELTRRSLLQRCT